MATETFSNLTKGGNGSIGPHYYSDQDTGEVLAQRNAVNYGLIDVVVNVSLKTVAVGEEVTVRVGMDINGNLLDGPDNKVALPCPPYCGKE